ncbi:MAG: hypothetical protein DMG23_05930 [Acidobacteria bacterium]|nr:MAG: hypothetical protein DMG23_05930 [Acidobacteriota bacterium]
MIETTSGNRVEIAKLILVPSLITLGVTILRVVGELQNWSPILFGKGAGGGGAIVGIAWLAPIFGIYFALKLSGTGAGPAKLGKTFALWGLGLLLLVSGGYLLFSAQFASLAKTVAGFSLMAATVVVQLWGWPSLTKVLVAYGYAARIPVLIVVFLAFRGSWGTHYDALPPGYESKGFASDFIGFGVLPQMILWIAFTVLAGTLFGAVAAAIATRRKPAAQPAA